MRGASFIITRRYAPSELPPTTRLIVFIVCSSASDIVSMPRVLLDDGLDDGRTPPCSSEGVVVPPAVPVRSVRSGDGREPICDALYSGYNVSLPGLLADPALEARGGRETDDDDEYFRCSVDGRDGGPAGVGGLLDGGLLASDEEEGTLSFGPSANLGSIALVSFMLNQNVRALQKLHVQPGTSKCSIALCKISRYSAVRLSHPCGFEHAIHAGRLWWSPP